MCAQCVRSARIVCSVCVLSVCLAHVYFPICADTVPVPPLWRSRSSADLMSPYARAYGHGHGRRSLAYAVHVAGSQQPSGAGSLAVHLRLHPRSPRSGALKTGDACAPAFPSSRPPSPPAHPKPTHACDSPGSASDVWPSVHRRHHWRPPSPLPPRLPRNEAIIAAPAAHAGRSIRRP